MTPKIILGVRRGTGYNGDVLQQKLGVRGTAPGQGCSPPECYAVTCVLLTLEGQSLPVAAEVPPGTSSPTQLTQEDLLL